MRTHRLHLDESFERPAKTGHMSRLPIAAAVPLAAFVAFVSLVGILSPTIYARETPNWAAQAIGQDWADLLIAVPWLSITGLLALRGSRPALFLLVGGMLYTFYEFVIYALAIHFNALFLAYCATLGVTFFALAGMAVYLLGEDVSRWYEQTAPTRTAGFFLIGVGVLFTMAWLADIVPALLRGTTPESVTEAGVATNPVYVIDLSVVLPLHLIAGIALLRHRRLGYTLAPIVLSFGVIMALSIAGMLVVMRQRGIDASLMIAASMAVVAAGSAAVLTLLLGRLRRS